MIRSIAYLIIDPYAVVAKSDHPGSSHSAIGAPVEFLV
jgi:hypothetical protein